MKAHHKDIDLLVKQYIENEVACEVGKNIEDIVFFSSHAINLKVFKDATKKLKKRLKHFDSNEILFLAQDTNHFILQHKLDIAPKSEKYAYLAKALLRAHIIINEAIMEHFIGLYKRAHSWDYLESRAEHIYTLLCDK